MMIRHSMVVLGCAAVVALGCNKPAQNDDPSRVTTSPATPSYAPLAAGEPTPGAASDPHGAANTQGATGAGAADRGGVDPTGAHDLALPPSGVALPADDVARVGGGKDAGHRDAIKGGVAGGKDGGHARAACSGKHVRMREGAREFCATACRGDTDCAASSQLCTGVGAVLPINGVGTANGKYCQ